MTPQSEGRYATSLLFTPRSVDNRGSGSEYRLPKTGANVTRSPSPEQGRQHRDGSFFREGSVSLGSGGGFQGGGRLFSREGSSYREGSAQPDTPAAGRRGGAVGERSRLGQAPPETAARGTPTLGRGYSPGLATSRGRRRSTTPQLAPQEAPLPPPTDSLFANSAVVGAAWATAEPSQAPEAEGQEHTQEPEAPSNDTSDQWIIVYGFKAGDLELLLREFGKCGEILQHGTFGAPASANWLYLQFQDKWAAQRALYRDGEQLSTTLMVGVRPLDAVHKTAIRRHLDADSGSQRSLAPKPALARRYLIDATPQPQGGVGRGVPPPSQSMWAKVNEFVFGL